MALKTMIVRLLALPLLFCLVLPLSGCRTAGIVVVDTAGAPIKDAKVVGISLSMGGQSTVTNKKGRASIPSAIQQTRWIYVTKEGYFQSDQIEVSAPKPIKVILRKRGE
ncbi:MAG: carboxypeptidase-like regulatory domain-containing protein [Nibricoccus sp.]